MTSSGRKRSVRNIVLAIILVGVTIILMFTRLGSLFGGEAPDPAPLDDYVAPADPSPPAAASETPDSTPQPPAPDTAPEPETTDMTFTEFSVQYGLLRENFRARDSLTALLVGKRVVWEGHLRNVTRYTSSFYVTVWPSTSYGGTTASVTFGHAFEDVLYALSAEDRIRFEGVVKRAGGSIGIDGMAIERIE
ncbi:MAG: hypothetical protein IIC18_01500 [Bacteroidetes bacterium]|nr:hypothetical protein [Bacteroidota bacterium]